MNPPGFPDAKRYYAVGFCAAPGVPRLDYALKMKDSWSAEQFNVLLAQDALPAGLIVLCPRVGTFVVTGDEATTRKALREAICSDCGVEVYTKATNGPILCEGCRQERRLESNRRYEERQREKAALKAFDPCKKRGYRVVYDPCDAPLAAGLILVQPLKNTFVIAGDDAVSRKALVYLRNSFSGPQWWPLN